MDDEIHLFQDIKDIHISIAAVPGSLLVGNDFKLFFNTNLLCDEISLGKLLLYVNKKWAMTTILYFSYMLNDITQQDKPLSHLF